MGIFEIWREWLGQLQVVIWRNVTGIMSGAGNAMNKIIRPSEVCEVRWHVQTYSFGFDQRKCWDLGEQLQTLQHPQQKRWRRQQQQQRTSQQLHQIIKSLLRGKTLKSECTKNVITYTARDNLCYLYRATVKEFSLEGYLFIDPCSETNSLYLTHVQVLGAPVHWPEPSFCEVQFYLCVGRVVMEV